MVGEKEGPMKKLIDLLSGKRANHSRGMQRALREIDTSQLARVMLALDKKHQDVLVRNMTKKANEILKKSMEMERIHKSQSGGKYPDLEEDAESICRVIEAYTAESYEEVQKYPAYEQELSFQTRKDTIETIHQISEFARTYGLMALDGLEKKTDNPLFQKALELMLLGIEPFLFEEILRNHEKRYLKLVEDIHTMIVEGFLSIQLGHHPTIVKDKLESIAGGE
jgi:hypothetical protein